MFEQPKPQAVYRREVEHLAKLAEQLKTEADPAEALHRWLRSNVEFVATKKGMATALVLAAHRPSELIAFSFDRLDRLSRLVRGIAARFRHR
jgi:hypothetical protein